MHYRNIKTGADIYVNSAITAPNYVLIEGTEQIPPIATEQQDPEAKQDPVKPVTKEVKKAAKKPTKKRAKK